MTTSSLVRRALLLSVLGLLLCGITMGQQTAARPDRGAMPGASYSISDLESISLSSGNLNMSIPLASLPPIAGGKLKLTLSAVYNSKVWNITRVENQLGTYNGCPSWMVDTPQESERGGWRISGGYDIQIRDAHEDVDYVIPQPTGGPTCETDPDENSRLRSNHWFRVVLVTPDGAEHDLRPVNNNTMYQGTRGYLYGHYKDTPVTLGTPMSYYSYDGSFISAVFNPNHTFTIYLNDGMKVTQTSDGVQRITDTNGNSIKIFGEVDGSITTHHYQDEQTGREIKYIYDQGANGGLGQGRVLYQTVDGTWETVYVNWGTTRVQGKLYKINDWDPFGGETGTGQACWYNNVLQADLTVIREIIYPVTESGQSARHFTFGYNSDTTATATDNARWSCGTMPQSYTRTVSKGMGALSQVTTPSGATVSYSYSRDGRHDYTQLDGINEIPRETVTQKQLTHDGVTETWTYNIIEAIACGGTVTGPDGSVTVESCNPKDPAFGQAYTVGEFGGLTVRSIRSGKERIDRHWTSKIFSGGYTNANGAQAAMGNFNPVMDAEYLSLLDGNGNRIKMSAKTYQYDYNGNVTQTTEYDWFDPGLVTFDSSGVPTGVPVCSGVSTDPPGCATVLRTVVNSYYNPALSADSANVYARRSLANGTPLVLNATKETTAGPSTVQFSYDGNSYGTAPTAGNMTMKGVWYDLEHRFIYTSLSYDSYGNVITNMDARNKLTTFAYDSATHAQPTSVTVDPQNGTGTQTTTTVFDFYTGLITSQTDPNGRVTEINYTNLLLNSVDPFGRPGMVKAPPVIVNGASQRHQTATYYADNSRTVTSVSDLNAEGDGLLKSQVISDQLGRTIESRQYETATDFITVRQDYDDVNRIHRTSNPFRAGESILWTTAVSDALGRLTSVTTPDSAVVGTFYYANQVLVKDQAGKERTSQTDAAGRLTDIWEITSSDDQTENINFPGHNEVAAGYRTRYTYDTLGNLLTVRQQKGTTGTLQTRTFTYDSLSRLRSALNPESGTINYTYDDNGNLSTKTDARGIVSTYVYDALNRATGRSYSDSTPAVTYVYDTVAQNGKGRLASVSSSVASYAYSEYDALGRVKAASEVLANQTGNQTYTSSYIYDLAGHVTSIKYPSLRTADYNYDGAGRLADRDAQHPAFTGTLGDGAPRTYASEIVYDAASRMTKEQFGTTTPLYNKLFYNVRGQLAEIRVGTYKANDPTWWNRGAIINHYSNNYGCWGASCNATDNNGNLMKQEVYVPGDDQISSYVMRWQQYGYDSVNRLTQVHEYTGNNSLDWQQQYFYDRYGNRSINNNSSATWGDGINNVVAAIDPNNNRMYATNDPNHNVMDYDLAGNQTWDYLTSSGMRIYDAENRMTSATDSSNHTNTYYYDGDGRRVKRLINNVETWQVYGLGGELLAEYAANADPLTPQKEYGYRNGQMLIIADAASGAGTRTNFALASNGATANASSVYSPSQGSGYSALAAEAINGDRTGRVNGSTSWWNDGSQNSGPDSLEVDFNGSKSIDEIDLFTVQDNYQSPSAPTDTMTFTLYGLTGFAVQYWNGSSWTDLTGNVSGNNKVWRKFTFAAITTNKIRVLANASADGWSRIAELEAWGGGAAPRTNVALASNGGTASASSIYSPSQGPGYNAMPAAANDGDRSGKVGGATNWWNDGTPNTWSDWLQIDFNGSKTIDEIDLFTTQDNYTSPAEPTEVMTFTLYGLSGYQVRYWNGSSWVDVPGCNVSGNNKVWRKLNFTAITTTKIRVLANASADGWSRITELEAWTATSGNSSAQLHWLVTDQLGTPRMIFDQSGSLATVSRHDYLPFGEELGAGTGGRTIAQGYTNTDGARQKFTQKDRDIETGLDYFGARYYASAQGRFTTPDPLMSSGTTANPQTWNRYSYVLNHPLEFTDPVGLYVFDSSVSESERAAFRAGLSKARSNLWKIAAAYGIHSNEFKKAQRAANVYGDEGVKNGVTIMATTDPNRDIGATQVAGVAKNKTRDNPTGQGIRITIRSDTFDSEGLDQIIGHEGSHAADGSDWVASGFANGKNPTTYQTEFDAYTVQLLQVQADFNNKGNCSTLIGGWHQDPGKAPWVPLRLTEWDESWKEADRATMRANNINNLLERPRDIKGYDVTPAHQGAAAFRKGDRFK